MFAVHALTHSLTRRGSTESASSGESEAEKQQVMGAESFCKKQNEQVEVAEAEAPFILGLQPSALVDNVAHADWSLLDQIPGERGGSIPVCILTQL